VDSSWDTTIAAAVAADIEGNPDYVANIGVYEALKDGLLTFLENWSTGTNYSWNSHKTQWNNAKDIGNWIFDKLQERRLTGGNGALIGTAQDVVKDLWLEDECVYCGFHKVPGSFKYW
jgi:hypothetical protein